VGRCPSDGQCGGDPLGSRRGRKTASVLVNGSPADYEVTSFTWRTIIAPIAGKNTYEIELFDETGARTDHASILLWRKPPVIVQGTVQVNQTWSEAAGPYLLNGSVGIAAGAEVTLEPGTVVFGNAGSALTVRGRLNAAGAAGRLIRFVSTASGVS